MNKESEIYGGERARMRADRKNSSAPTPCEQRVYERELNRALKGEKNPQVLVLGATPELRDIAIKQGARSLAVDYSWDTLVAMTEVMKHKGHKLDLMMRCDWERMANYLKLQSFHAIVGDASFLNVPFNAQKKILQDCAKLLARNGRLIIRHAVYLPEKIMTFAKWQKGYNKGKFYWLSVWPLWHYVGNAYDKTQRILSVKKLFDEYYIALERGDIHIKKTDRSKLDNIFAYGNEVLHWTETKNEFERKIAKWFQIERIVKNSEFIFPDAVVVYVLRKRKAVIK